MSNSQPFPKKELLYWGLGFALFQAVAIAFEAYYFSLIPFALFAFYLAIYRLEWIWFFTVACTPISINLEQLEIAKVGMYLPTEPIIAGLLILMIFKIISGKSVSRNIFGHPMTYIIGAYLLWMFFTSITSEFPLVSFKFMATRLWFISGFYLIGSQIFENPNKLKTFVAAYMTPLMFVIGYTVFRHSQFNFDKQSAHWVMEPLFKDHTSYGAVLALFYPVSFASLFWRKKNALITFLTYASFLILTIGLVLSYTRAAWLSVAIAGVVWILIIMRVKLKTIVWSGLALGLVLLFTWGDIQQTLGRNKQESSDKLDEHVSSISNVSSDASNLERLNRWHCALEMFNRRPITGWGPGTYQFVYAPFQRSKDRTIISTNNGDGGNAHSEYLGPLAEEGILGLLTISAIVIYMIHLSFKLIYSIKEKELKNMVIAVFLGLLTYFIHGTLNNYLDTDKASVPVWSFLAFLIAVDLHQKASAKSLT